jgi:selenide,water dikinase
MQSDTPVVRDLLLIGGGHSHVQVLKHFAMQPPAGVRLTLVCDADVAPYSGMVPGYIAGHYALDEIQIAMQPLCRAAGARFVCAEVTALDRHNKRVVFADRPSMSYDLLSINCGARPDLQGLPGVAVKPLGEFLAHWPSLQSKIEQQDACVANACGGWGRWG